MGAHEGLFLVGPEWRWNWFDAVIVSVSILERFVTTGAGSSAFRLLRILKLSRSARSVRLLRMFPSMCPLQFLLLSCKNSLPALCWTCVLLLVLLFLFSAVLTSPVAYFVTQLPHNDPIAETLRYHFGSMSMCMLTLFLTFIGEVDFREVILVLLEVDLAWCAPYVAFVLFATLAMTNIVAGIFIADAMELTSQDRDIRQRGELVRSRKNLQLLTALFHEMDALGTGLISQSDFEEQLQRPEVLSLLSYFNLDVTDATAFFTLLDADEDGFVDIEEFTVGCLRMHGKSNAIDMEISIQETKRLALSIDRALQQDTEKIENRIEKVSRTSHGHEVKLLGMICTMEASLRSIEERLGIRDVKTAAVES